MIRLLSLKQSHLKKQKGFTLVEVVVVSVLLALLAGILYGTLTGIMNAKRAIEQQRDSLRTARTVLLRMIRELNGAMSESLVFTDTKQRKLGEEESQSLLGNNSADHDYLYFITTSGAQAVFGGTSNYGNIQIGYRLEEDPEKIYSNPEITGINTFVLVREEVPAGLTDEKLLKQRRIVFPIAADIVALNFRYKKNKKWKDSWVEKTGELPEAIEITLKIAGIRTIDTYRTAVALRRSNTALAVTKTFEGFNN